MTLQVIDSEGSKTANDQFMTVEEAGSIEEPIEPILFELNNLMTEGTESAAEERISDLPPADAFVLDQ